MQIFDPHVASSCFWSPFYKCSFYLSPPLSHFQKNDKLLSNTWCQKGKLQDSSPSSLSKNSRKLWVLERTPSRTPSLLSKNIWSCCNGIDSVVCNITVKHIAIILTCDQEFPCCYFHIVQPEIHQYILSKSLESLWISLVGKTNTSPDPTPLTLPFPIPAMQ